MIAQFLYAFLIKLYLFSMNNAVFACLFLYFIFIFWSDVVIFILFCCCSLLSQRGRGVYDDVVLVSACAASHLNHGFLSVRLSGSKLSFSSFTQVFTAADRQIRPRQWKRVTNLLLITINTNTFVLINLDEIECARTSDQVLQCCGPQCR